MRRMTVHDYSTENNDISIQFLYFTIRNTVKNTKQRHDTQYKFTAHSKRRRHFHYVQYTERSGPFIVSPERRRLSLLQTVEQPVRASKGFSRVIFYMWTTAGGCEIFLSTCCKVRHESTGTAAVLEGQDSKNGTEW